MAKFRDKHGHEWLMEFTLGSLARVKSETGVDLLTFHIANSPAMQALQDDPMLLLRVLQVQLRPQLRERGVSDEEFSDSLLEEHAYCAVEALISGMVDYYPPAKRAALQPVVQTTISAARNVRDRADRTLRQEMARVDLNELQGQLETEIERSISGITTGSLAGSPESTRVDSPSGS